MCVIGTSFEQGKVYFKMETSNVVLTCKHVSKFNEHIIAQSKLIPIIDIPFEHTIEFRAYKITDQKTNNFIFKRKTNWMVCIHFLLHYHQPKCSWMPLTALDTTWIGTSLAILARNVCVYLVDGVSSLKVLNDKIFQCMAYRETNTKRARTIQPT